MTAPGDFAVEPPQALWYKLMAGDQAASFTMSAAAHQALAELIQAEAAQMGLTTSGTAAAGWQGAGGLSMLSSAGEFIAALELLMAWMQDSSASAASIAEGYNTARTTMVPGPVSDANRASQAGFVATNWFGQNTPVITALDIEYGRHWATNAGAMALYQAVLLGLLGLLGLPPPMAAPTADPAAAAADAAMGAAESGSNAGMQGALHGTQEAGQLTGPAGQAAAAPAEAGQGMASIAPMLMGQFGQLGQMAGQVPQAIGQLPQMLGQMPSMAMGMLGPLASGFGSMGAGAGIDPAAATITQASATLPPGGIGAGGGGGGGIGGSGGVLSSFTRPASSFNAPNPPKLPSGWSSVVETPQVAGSTQPMAGGTGGLYGAPMAANAARGDGSAAEKPARTMQLAGRAPGRRGDDREN